MHTCGVPPEGSILLQDIQPLQSQSCVFSMLVFNGSDGVSQKVQQERLWDAVQTYRMARLLGASSASGSVTLLDIGANLGWFTLLAAACFKAEVIAVEASPRNAQLLNYSLCLNHAHGRLRRDQVTLHNVGVGAHRAETCALVARRGNMASPATICGTEAAKAKRFMNNWGSRFRWFRRAMDYHVLGTMDLTRVDDLIRQDQRVDIIKIDVEGHELEVSKGWQQLFRHRMPQYVFTEFVPSLVAKVSNTTQPDEYLRFFVERGYVLHRQLPYHDEKAAPYSRDSYEECLVMVAWTSRRQCEGSGWQLMSTHSQVGSFAECFKHGNACWMNNFVASFPKGNFTALQSHALHTDSVRPRPRVKAV